MSQLFHYLSLLCTILSFAVFLRAIISWFPISPDNSLVVILYQVTEPIIAPLRKVIPRLGMIDITPLVAMILLQIVASMLDTL